MIKIAESYVALVVPVAMGFQIVHGLLGTDTGADKEGRDQNISVHLQGFTHSFSKLYVVEEAVGNVKEILITGLVQHFGKYAY